MNVVLRYAVAIAVIVLAVLTFAVGFAVDSAETQQTFNTFARYYLDPRILLGLLLLALAVGGSRSLGEGKWSSLGITRHWGGLGGGEGGWEIASGSLRTFLSLAGVVAAGIAAAFLIATGGAHETERTAETNGVGRRSHLVLYPEAHTSPNEVAPPAPTDHVDAAAPEHAGAPPRKE